MITKLQPTESQQGHSWTAPMHWLVVVMMKLVDQVKSNINDKTKNGWVLVAGTP
jgi:hypothetical protein